MPNDQSNWFQHVTDINTYRTACIRSDDPDNTSATFLTGEVLKFRRSIGSNWEPDLSITFTGLTGVTVAIAKNAPFDDPLRHFWGELKDAAYEQRERSHSDEFLAAKCFFSADDREAADSSP